MLLIETKFDDVLTEAVADTTTGNKKLMLKGVFMESERRNRNGRIYKRAEMEKQVQRVNEAALAGRFIVGELDHSSNLVINLRNASHKILEMRMVGDDAIGKAEIMEKTPCGQIAKSLIESGLKLGVSSRASGEVNEDTGIVEGFFLVTCDIVASPSAIDAYPTALREQLETYHRQGYIHDLAEAVLHDTSAQKYFEKEIRKFITDCLTSK